MHDERLGEIFGSYPSPAAPGRTGTKTPVGYNTRGIREE